jgi:hypothetical protein
VQISLICARGAPTGSGCGNRIRFSHPRAINHGAGFFPRFFLGVGACRDRGASTRPAGRRLVGRLRRDEACARLARDPTLIASFSRALLEGVTETRPASSSTPSSSRRSSRSTGRQYTSSRPADQRRDGSLYLARRRPPRPRPGPGRPPRRPHHPALPDRPALNQPAQVTATVRGSRQVRCLRRGGRARRWLRRAHGRGSEAPSRRPDSSQGGVPARSPR